MPSRRRDPLLDQAGLDAQLRTQPQYNALRQLLTGRAQTYDRTRKVNANTAEVLVQSAQQARPAVDSAFATALASVQAQRAAIGANPADPQAQAYERRVGEARGNALTDLTQRELRAQEGRVYANENAREEYFGDKDKIQRQMLEVAQQAGVLTASRYNELKEDQRKRALQRRQQDISDENADLSRDQSQSNADRTHELAVARERRQASQQGSTGGRTAAQQAAHVERVRNATSEFRTTVETVVELINSSPDKDQAGRPLTPDRLRALLLTNKNPSGRAYDAVTVNAALDLAGPGTLSAASRRRIRSMPNVRIPRDWLPNRGRPTQRVGGNTPGPGRSGDRPG